MTQALPGRSRLRPGAGPADAARARQAPRSVLKDGSAYTSNPRTASTARGYTSEISTCISVGKLLLDRSKGPREVMGI